MVATSMVTLHGCKVLGGKGDGVVGQGNGGGGSDALAACWPHVFLALMHGVRFNLDHSLCMFFMSTDLLFLIHGWSTNDKIVAKAGRKC